MIEPREIVETLESRGAGANCPACGSTERSVVRPPVALVASPDPETFAFDRDAVSVTWCAAVVCENCGLVRLHALSTLETAPDA